MLQSEIPSLHKSRTTKSKPKQSQIMADLKPGLACFTNYPSNLRKHVKVIHKEGKLKETYIKNTVY